MRPNLKQDFPVLPDPINVELPDFEHLASQIAQIAQKLSFFERRKEQADLMGSPVVDSAMLRRMLSARRARAAYFPDGMFADPAWDILLDLLIARLDQARVSITSSCHAANVPQTTALRWIKVLENEDLISRHADRLDGRRMFLELTPKAVLAMKNYFCRIGLELVD